MRYLLLVLALSASAPAADKWATVWTGSVHGPYPAGNAVAQPDLSMVFPNKEAREQTFRLIVRPDLWGSPMRFRFSNVFGSKPLVLDNVFAGEHEGGGQVIGGTNRPVLFGGKQVVEIAPGSMFWSDPVAVAVPKQAAGRKLAVSFHVAGTSGPMTWHAKSLQTSYVSGPNSGAHGAEEDAENFPFTTTSWYFLDAVDAMVPDTTQVVVAFGDSITDGTASTINGDDRWPDFFSRRMHARFGSRFAVVNAGIGGNQVVGPAKYETSKPPGGGPSALDRLDRDVLELSGVTSVVWLEAINDIGAAGATVEAVIQGYRDGVARLHAKKIRVVGATVTSALGAASGAGKPEVDAARRTINQFIRTGGLFDGVADFDGATLDPASGALKAEFQPNSSTGGPGDKLHPNRAGYKAMAYSIDLGMFEKSGKLGAVANNLEPERGRILGIGGLFLKSANSAQLGQWYEENLGIKAGPYGTSFPWRDHDDPAVERVTAWSIFKQESKYFDPSTSQFMVNYIVDDLDAILARLNAKGAKIDPKREDHEYGRFAWVFDADGNKIELWEPKTAKL